MYFIGGVFSRVGQDFSSFCSDPGICFQPFLSPLCWKELSFHSSFATACIFTGAYGDWTGRMILFLLICRQSGAFRKPGRPCDEKDSPAPYFMDAGKRKSRNQRNESKKVNLTVFLIRRISKRSVCGRQGGLPSGFSPHPVTQNAGRDRRSR